MGATVFDIELRVVIYHLTRCTLSQDTQKQEGGRSEWLASKIYVLRELGLGVGPVETGGDHPVTPLCFPGRLAMSGLNVNSSEAAINPFSCATSLGKPHFVLPAVLQLFLRFTLDSSCIAERDISGNV